MTRKRPIHIILQPGQQKGQRCSLSLRYPFRGLGILVFCAAMILGLRTQGATAQPVKPEIRIAVQEDNPAIFVYHTALPPIGHGFNIYRKYNAEDEYEQLNQYPVRGVASGTELRAFLGTLYDDIEHTTQQTTDNGTLTKLRSDFKTANLLTFIYPEIAEALGRLYIDNNTTLDVPATYKIEFVDALDTPTGEILEQTSLLLPQKPDAPSHLRAENQGNLITLFWRHIPPSANVDDKVIRFEAFRIDPTNNQPVAIHDKVLLRNNALFEYALTFEVPTVGQTEQLYVQSIDITGQASDPSAILRYDAIDLDPPNVVLNVEAVPLSNQRIQVSWRPANPASQTRDLAGYNVYRSTSLNDFGAYERLNDIPLSLNETVFNDTLKQADGSQIYFYRVAPLDASGNEGDFSTAAMAQVEDHVPPQPPSNLTASLTATNEMALAWEAENLPADFETFIVLRRRLGPYASSIPHRVNNSALTDAQLKDKGEAGKSFMEGATYRYSVLSADKAGNFSDQTTIDIKIPDVTPPAAPNGVQALVENASRVAVFWNPSQSTDVMSYVVYRRQAGSTALTSRILPGHTRRYGDEDAVQGSTYEYWVTAADSAGNESLPSPAFRIEMRDEIPPRSVRNVQLYFQDDAFTLSWEPVSAFDLAGYRILEAGSLSSNFEPVSDALLTETRWQIEGEVEERCFLVRAIDIAGNASSDSRPACLPLNENP